MKICIAGKNNIAVLALEYLIYDLRFPREDIFVIPTKTDTGKDSWQRSLIKCAKEEGIKISSLEDVYKIEDLIFFSLEFDRIVDPSKFRSNRLFNIHFSLLPRYKGMYTSVWPILNNEKFSGVTLHYIDKGIDTGPIISQKKIKIGFYMTARDLYFKYLEKGLSLFKEYILKILKNEYIPAKRQYFRSSSYFSKKSIDFSNIKIDLNQTALNIHNQIRAFNFREYQLPEVFGKKVIGSRILRYPSNKKPGTVLYEDDISIAISTVDYNMILFKDIAIQVFELCKNGNPDLLEKYTQIPNIFNVQDRYGKTPLIVAIEHKNLEVIKFLLKNNVDLDIPDFKGKTPFMYAVDSGYDDIVKLLLDFGATSRKV